MAFRDCIFIHCSHICTTLKKICFVYCFQTAIILGADIYKPIVSIQAGLFLSLSSIAFESANLHCAFTENKQCHLPVMTGNDLFCDIFINTDVNFCCAAGAADDRGAGGCRSGPALGTPA